MIFYIDLKAGDTPISLAVDTTSFSAAASMAAAWSAGFMSAEREDNLPGIILESIVSGKRPRGKTYFNLHDADAIRRGLKI